MHNVSMSWKLRTHLIDRSEFYETTARLQHYACFHYRKAFKQGFPAQGSTVPCPQCRQPMTNMGTDFKAPPHRNQEQWSKVERLASAGIRFFPTWPEGIPGYRPATLSDVPAFLRRTFPPSKGQMYLECEPGTTSPAPREGKVMSRGHAPHVQHRLLGKPLENGATVEVWHQGAWRLGRLMGAQNNLIHTVLGAVPLTPDVRLRWPTKQ